MPPACALIQALHTQCEQLSRAFLIFVSRGRSRIMTIFVLHSIRFFMHVGAFPGRRYVHLGEERTCLLPIYTYLEYAFPNLPASFSSMKGFSVGSSPPGGGSAMGVMFCRGVHDGLRACPAWLRRGLCMLAAVRYVQMAVACVENHRGVSLSAPVDASVCREASGGFRDCPFLAWPNGCRSRRGHTHCL